MEIQGECDGWRWHLLVILLVSAGFESLFIHYGIGWLFDEGWPLYAAMRLHEGGVLYKDIFFLFPPGHLFPAWLAYAIDPPGIILARYIYAAFNVLLCLAMYPLARKLMRPSFALLAVLLLAVAAPRSHLAHLLFGYRFFVISVLALLAFSARVRSGNPRWMLAAGACAGIALAFRLTPPFAISCGIGIAVMSIDRAWRSWIRDWILYAAGLLAVTAPVLLWFAMGVGLEALWEGAVLRILPLQGAQGKPIPEMIWLSTWDREQIYKLFVPIQYYGYTLLYLGYTLVLGRGWARSIRQKRPFESPLLLAIVIAGAIYFLRTLGRSDEHHLTSALPPACLVIAHALDRAHRAFAPRLRTIHAPRHLLELTTCLLAFGLWVFFQGSDLYLDVARRGTHPLRSLDETVRVADPNTAQRVDWQVRRILAWTEPGDTFLDLTNAPMLHVLTGRSGPGYSDVITPGVFDEEEDELAFLEVLETSKPALVLWPSHPFDWMRSRSLPVIAPHVTKWVFENYEKPDQRRGKLILRRLDSLEDH